MLEFRAVCAFPARCLFCLRGSGVMAACHSSKVKVRVQFPSPTPTLFYQERGVYAAIVYRVV